MVMVGWKCEVSLKPPHDHLQPVLKRLMAKDREQRYPSAQAFLDDLALLEP